MHIANPMYDNVFKYLLEDNALAKLLIGTILQEEILSLEFRPQERTQPIGRPGERVLTVYRLDFAARVRNAAGIKVNDGPPSRRCCKCSTKAAPSLTGIT